MSFQAFFILATISAIGAFDSVPIPIAKIAAISVPSLDFDCPKNCILSNVIERARKAPLQERLSLINSAVNQRIQYASDETLYARIDYWASPNETVAKLAGDCEDFAILKMASLLRVGIPRERMAIVVVQDTKRNLVHAVLSVSTDKGTMILDSLHRDVRPDKTILHYQPLFSVNGQGSWLHGKRITTSATETPDTLGLSPAKTVAMIDP
ncbi:transglutaminase-like cysteine peptidase [Rhizobium sp. MHM7A]|uniref:transglutaminase-like cysteine peptidase n=1 Tax=Rhizobium sp. MHM7A TaxID=2583233 RepID=UPI0011061992|nr:transglutaminase-like cysteine peptidase [Rhizobium sp. MHM7A]TLX17212.1 hypothetical protein FFR93_07915 [Rhizobium sp. MHM7A]